MRKRRLNGDPGDKLDVNVCRRRGDWKMAYSRRNNLSEFPEGGESKASLRNRSKTSMAGIPCVREEGTRSGRAKACWPDTLGGSLGFNLKAQAKTIKCFKLWVSKLHP